MSSTKPAVLPSHLVSFTSELKCRVSTVFFLLLASLLSPAPAQRHLQAGSKAATAMGWAARFLTAVSFLAAGTLFAPDALRLGSSGVGAAAAARLIHLLAFATAWGAGLWVTFIGGIVMFKRLPRHQFGSLQGKMFPTYFMLISASSALLPYLRQH
ncbi:unnamed protein product [Urochloa humidicola]